MRWEEGKLHEDEYFFLDFYERFNKVVCLSDQFYYYRKNAVSITNTIRVSRYLNIADVMRERILKCIDKKYLDGIFKYEKTMYDALKTIYTKRKRVVNDALVNIKKYQNTTKCVYNMGKMSRWQYTKRNLMYFCMCVVFRINRRTRGK